MSSINFLDSLKTVSDSVNEGKLTRHDIIDQFLINLSNVENVGAWVQDFDLIKKMVLRNGSEDFIESKSKLLPLNGLVVGVKDIISTREFPTLMGTNFWTGTPGAFDARIISRMRDLGAIIGGKTKCSEFAVHKTTGTTNPRYPSYEPGTSSSGSAAAIANGEVTIALGTQTAGSIIKPASYCGILGFKPSFGDIPRTGILKTTELFDTVGFFGRRVSDLTKVYLATRVSGEDHPIHLKSREKQRNTKFGSVIVFSGLHIDDPNSLLQTQLITLGETLAKSLSVEVVDSIQFDFHSLRKSFFNVYYRDLAYFIRDHNIENKVSAELLLILHEGLNLRNKEYLESRAIISQWQSIVCDLPKNPLILSLSTSTAAPKLGEKDSIDANIFITSAGFPQASIPLLRNEYGQLVGVSLSAQRFSDESLLELVAQIFPDDALKIK